MSSCAGIRIERWLPGALLALALMFGAKATFADTLTEVFTSYPARGGVLLKMGWDNFVGTKINSYCVVAGSITDQGQNRTFMKLEIAIVRHIPPTVGEIIGVE
jgi:hypothetical protein